MPRLILLHTNDMHGRLTAEVAERIRILKAREENVLLLDAGDAVRAGNLGVAPWGDKTLRLMNRACYDMMAAGNRETHLWRWAARAKLRSASFPILCANVAEQDVYPGQCEAMTRSAPAVNASCRSLYRQSVEVCLPNGIRVAVLGLTIPMVTTMMATRYLSQYLFQDPIETAGVLVPEIARRVDVVIALTPLGLARDQELARRVPGIHLIVGGHSHEALAQPVQMNGTVILQAGSYARHLGRAEITLENGFLSARAELIPLREKIGGARSRLR